MEYNIYEKTVKSTDGIHSLAGTVYEPVGEKKGILHIVHGMCEYIGRYQRFMDVMASAGYVCCGYNHVGHKDTSSDGELGFFADNNGDKILVDDVHEFAESVRAEYPDLPYILMGHSMGSFVVRLTAAKYPDGIDGLIIMGTGGKNPAAGAGILLTDILKTFGKGKSVSGLIQGMAFGKYNERTDNKTPNDWLTHDEEIIAAYSADKYCTFKFTNSAMRDLIAMNRDSNLDACMGAYHDDMPIIIVSGADDPVGDYGKATEWIAQRLGELGKSKVTLKNYDGMRHEILNEIGKETVDADIMAWCDKVVAK